MKILSPVIVKVIATGVIVFGSIGMYFVWNKIYEPGQKQQEQVEYSTAPTNETTGEINNGDTNNPIFSDIAEPTSTDPTGPDKITPSDPTPKTIMPATPQAISCSEIKEATFKKCRAECPAEPDIEIYHECTANCDKINNLLTKNECINKCISDWSKANSARSDCTSGCLKDYYATKCP